MKKPGLWILAGLFLGLSVWIVLSNHQIKQNTVRIQAALMHGVVPDKEEITPEMIQSLPLPVRRYMVYALGDRKYKDVLVRLKHAGWIQINRDSDYDRNPDWKYFFAENTIRLDRPACFWQGMIHLGWEFYLKGWIHYQGHGSEMIWTWMGTIPLWQRHEQKMKNFGLGQMLIQAPWMPTLLLSADIQWQAVDDTTARARLSSDSVDISGIFHFNTDGRIVRWVGDDWARVTPAGFLPCRRMVKYAHYDHFGPYKLPARLFYFLESPAGWVSDADLRLDEILYD